MHPERNDDGTWRLVANSTPEAAMSEKSQSPYLEALTRYLTSFDLAFTRAKQTSEHAFVQTLLGVRGLQDSGWDPFESSIQAIREVRSVHKQITSFTAARHIELWIYGHIVEASEPYEILANMIAIARGDTFRIARFPAGNKGRPPSSGEKINQLTKDAEAAGMPEVMVPMQELRDRHFRNAIFHSDYSLHGGEVRFKKDGLPEVYKSDEIFTLVNRAIAYFDALAEMRRYHVRSFTKPVELQMHPENRAHPEERAVAMVREGYGVIGLKDVWTAEQRKSGHIPWRIGRFTKEEIRLAGADPTRALFPPLPSKPDAATPT